MVADSLEHDVRAVAQRQGLDRGAQVAPDVSRKAPVAAELKAASPMRAKVDQDSTISTPPFDAADQFRMDTGDNPRPVAEVLKLIDDEQAATDIIKKSL